MTSISLLFLKTPFKGCSLGLDCLIRRGIYCSDARLDMKSHYHRSLSNACPKSSLASCHMTAGAYSRISGEDPALTFGLKLSNNCSNALSARPLSSTPSTAPNVSISVKLWNRWCCIAQLPFITGVIDTNVKFPTKFQDTTSNEFVLQVRKIGHRGSDAHSSKVWQSA